MFAICEVQKENIIYDEVNVVCKVRVRIRKEIILSTVITSKIKMYKKIMPASDTHFLTLKREKSKESVKT
jgi:hypothetical protein